MKVDSVVAKAKLEAFIYASLVWKLFYGMAMGGLDTLCRDLYRYTEGNRKGDRGMPRRIKGICDNVENVAGLARSWPVYCAAEQAHREALNAGGRLLERLEREVQEPLSDASLNDDVAAMRRIARSADEIYLAAKERHDLIWQELQSAAVYAVPVEFTEQFVVAFDMVGYSRLARRLHKLNQHPAVFALNRMILEIVRSSVRSLGLRPEEMVIDMAGDGGLIYFDEIATALRFVDALKEHTTQPAAPEDRREWRVGISHGFVGFRYRYSMPDRLVLTETGGIPIIDAVRVMNGGDPGDVIVTREAYERLSPSARSGFEAVAPISAKAHERRAIEVMRRKRA